MKRNSRPGRLRMLLALALASALFMTACGSDALDTVTDAVDDAADAAGDAADAATDAAGDAADTVTDAAEDAVDAATDAAGDAADTVTDAAEDAVETATDTAEDTMADSSANTAEVVAAADALIALLSDDEASALVYDFGDATITSGWSNLPACSGDRAVIRAGIQLGDMSEDQQAATLALAAAVLSDDGYTEFENVRIADDYLQDTLGNTIWDSECYSMAIYGTPSTTDAFAVQFGGHHFARMATYEGDTVTITPSFTGVEPGTFEIDGVAYDIMGDEMSSVYGIFTSLDADQAAAAELGTAPGTIVMGPGTDSPFPDSEGLLVSELSEDQQALVVAAMQAFVEDYDSSVAAALMAEYESELDETYIAWATGIDTETSGAYARIDGPNVWIEVSNEDGATGIHFHGIYRDKNDDYGDAA